MLGLTHYLDWFSQCPSFSTDLSYHNFRKPSLGFPHLLLPGAPMTQDLILIGLRQGFLNLGTVNIWIILCCEGCTLHYRLLSSIPGFYLLDANCVHTYIHTIITTKNVSNCPLKGKLPPGKKVLF